MNSKNFCILILIFLFLPIKVFSQKINLSNTINWKYNIQDNIEFLKKDFDDSKWQNYKNINKINSNILWLRTKIYTSTTTSRQALNIQGLCGYEQIYINGILINKDKSKNVFYDRCNRNETFPLSGSINKNYEDSNVNLNVIAIRLQKTSFFSNPKIDGLVKIIPIYEAQNLIFSENIFGLIYSFISLLMSILILSFFRNNLTKEQKYLSIYFGTYSIYKFLQNDFVYNFIDLSSFTARFAFSLIGILNILFYFFYTKYLDFNNLNISNPLLKFQINKNKLDKLVFNYCIFFSFLLSISPNLNIIYNLPIIFSISLIPLYLFYIVLAFQNYKVTNHKSLFALVGFSIFLILIINSIFNGKLDFFNQSKTGFGMLSFNFCFFISFFYNIVLKNREIETQNSGNFNLIEIQERIFSYFNSILAKPCERLTILINEIYILPKNKKNLNINNINEKKLEISKLVNQIQIELDKIIILSSFEQIKNLTNITKFNVNKALTNIINKSDIKYHTHIEKEIYINNSHEFFNTLISHIITFFSELKFLNVDLVVISNDSNIDFHFLGFHKESQKINEIYKICNYINPLRDPMWIKWAIINECVRILNSKIYIRQVRDYFLRVSLSIPTDYSKKDLTTKWDFTTFQKKNELFLKFDNTENKLDNILENNTVNSFTKKSSSSSRKFLDKINFKKKNFSSSNENNKEIKFNMNISISDLFKLLKQKLFKK